MEILQYPFMQKALFVGLLLGILVPSMGFLMVTKRYSMIGDALSHMSLAGISIGLIFNFNPILAAVLASLFGALSIDVIRKQFPAQAEVSIAILTSAGIGIAGLLSGLVPNAANFNSFLFGSIVAITDEELWLVVFVFIVVMCLFVLLYKEFYLVALDEKNARLLGINVNLVNFISLLLTAITISVAAKVVGALIVSSLMVIPVVSALQVGKSYKQTIVYSLLFGLIYTMSGLVLSFYLDLKPGATIVVIGLIVLFGLILSHGIVRSINQRKEI